MSLNWRPSGDGSVGTEQRQGIALCIYNWKRSNPTAKPNPQIVMKTASQCFLTIAEFTPVKDFFWKWVRAPIEGFAPIPTELTFEAFCTKRIQPLLKPEVVCRHYTPHCFGLIPWNQQTIQKPCDGLTGDQKPTGKKTWRNMSGPYMHM